jgi:VIT1/CCC1 family predicted Fe2+/Mn2+ transporter
MLTRNLDKAREAYKKKNVEELKLAHRTYAKEMHQHEQGQYVKSLIYGGLDGIITTFAVVSGVAGASLPAGVVLILGFANLVADGLSMGIGDYLSTKAESEYKAGERERETWEVDHYPEGEKQEMVEIYKGKGMSEEDAKAMVEIMARYKEAWLDIMMLEELGIIESDESPLKNAIATFLSFCFFGFIPLIVYVLSLFLPAIGPYAFPTACVLTGGTLFTLGALKTLITKRHWIVSGLEMFGVGGIAAAAAYVIGYLLSGLA